MTSHHHIVKAEFEKQAKQFSKQGLNQSNRHYIEWILKDVQLTSDTVVLDVAAGTGIMSRAIAPFVSKVVAIDISKDMVQQGENETKQANIQNIEFVEGAVEALPFADHSFDVVISRFAFHHFVQPKQVLSEMKRVCTRNGLIVVVDITPNDVQLAEDYNKYEKLRDPSHTKALTSQEFIELFDQLKIECTSINTTLAEVHLNNWLSLTSTVETVSEKIKEDLLNDLNGDKETGLNPFIRNGELMFQHTYIKLVGNVL